MTVAPSPCGACTLCCKLLGVAELRKPVDSWCASCTPGSGCRVHDARPTSCRDFACCWLTAREDGVPVPDGMRPDRCHVVFHEPLGAGNLLVAHVDPARPRAWTSGIPAAYLASAVKAGFAVTVQAGRDRFLVDSDGIHAARETRDAAGAPVLERTRRIGRIA